MRKTRSRKPERPEAPRRWLKAKAPLLAALACSLFSCDPKLPERPPRPELPPAADASYKKPEAPAREAPPPARLPGPAAPAREHAPNAPPPGCPDNLCLLSKQGHRRLSELITLRSRPHVKKMRLTYEEAELAAGYLVKDLHSMPRTGKMLKLLPRTAIELVRSVNERGVEKADAEKMARYLSRLVHIVSSNRDRFDDCISHVIGREWHQIDYSGEGMTWQGQKRFYAPAKVHDLKTALHLHRYFTVEVKLNYFKKLFKPRGRLPPAPE